ncbi:MAG: hypothetical protein DMF62_15995 [Acidobacteria bacterium]|nr:MAG: hypothetical protein DMF62_15995 [Acidobacteriota bacterium]
MNKRLLGTTVLAVCIVTGFLIMSCAPATQNTNQNQSQNQNLTPDRKGSDAAATDDLPSDPDICKMSDIGDRITNLRAKLKEKIKGNNGKGKLKDQLEGIDLNGKHYPPSFTYEFYPYPETAPKYVYLFIAGSVHGRQPFQDLAEFAEDFVQKGCTNQVFFVGRLPRSGEELSLRDLGPFEWSGCEYPMLACADGECKNPCDRKFGFDIEPNTSEKANALAPPNAKANTAASGNRIDNK